VFFCREDEPDRGGFRLVLIFTVSICQETFLRACLRGGFAAGFKVGEKGSGGFECLPRISL